MEEPANTLLTIQGPPNTRDNDQTTTLPRKNAQISNEKRALIMHAIDTLGMSVRDVSQHYQVARSTISSIKRVFYSEGQRTRKKPNRGNTRTLLSAEQKSIILRWLDNDCSMTLPVIRRGCLTHFGINVSESTLSRVLRSFHYTIKRTSTVAERASSQDVIEQRIAYAREYLRIMSRRESIYFVDETGFNCLMRHKTGRAPIGQRAVTHVSAIRAKNFSLCVVYNIASMIHFEVLNRPYNTVNFVGFLEIVMEKFREQVITEAIVIMDNVSFHHSQSVKTIIEGAGHRIMFLPPYSPFLNPIENVFNQWKHWVKCSQPSNEDELFLAIQTGCQAITSQQCRNYYDHMEGFIERCLTGEEIEG
jgi:transposase